VKLHRRGNLPEGTTTPARTVVPCCSTVLVPCVVAAMLLGEVAPAALAQPGANQAVEIALPTDDLSTDTLLRADLPTALSTQEPATAGSLAGDIPNQWLAPEGFASTFRLFLLLSVLSLAPGLILMTTCFVRITVVLYLLRQALGMQQLPPNQVVAALAVFLTALVMAPVWKQVHADAIRPYTERKITADEAWRRGTAPLNHFMSAQIERAGNSDDVWLFLEYLPDRPEPETYDQVPLEAMAPAFLLSELKTAFVIGFQIYLPFLIIDLVVAAVLTSMGMFMLPPSFVAIPFKLLLFVLADGWHLVVSALLQSFAPALTG
jgi:flagellar biosynthetic protein FliP